MGMMQEFREFAVKGNVIDLAVGVIIGGAFGKIVDSVVSDLIMPIVGLAFGKLDFSSHFIALGNVPPGTAMTLDALKKAGVPVLAYGSFLTVAVNFIILAFIIFLMVKQINRMKREAPAAPAPAPAAPPEDIVLLREIRDSLKRCAATAWRCAEARRTFSLSQPLRRAHNRHALSESAAARPGQSARQQASHAHCLDQARGLCESLARNVEGGSMIGTGSYQRQAQRHVHALVHAQVLDRNQALVVVHRHHHIELACALRGAAGPHEHGVRRQRPRHVKALGARCSHRWRNHLDFLPAKQPSLAGMRVEARHGHSRAAAQAAQQGCIGDAQGLQHVVVRHCGNRVAQRHVDADQHRTQFITGQHHAHRHFVKAHSRMGGRLRLKQLGVTREIHACG